MQRDMYSRECQDDPDHGPTGVSADCARCQELAALHPCAIQGHVWLEPADEIDAEDLPLRFCQLCRITECCSGTDRAHWQHAHSHRSCDKLGFVGVPGVGLSASACFSALLREEAAMNEAEGQDYDPGYFDDPGEPGYGEGSFYRFRSDDPYDEPPGAHL